MSDVTVTTEPPMGNSPEARNPDGSLKDPQANTTLTPKEPTEPKANEPPKDGDKAPPKAGDKAPDKSTEPTTGAPEKYADFKAPDGFKFDDKFLPQVQTAFKDLNLSQDQAQKLVDLVGPKFAELANGPAKAWSDTQAQWNTEIATRFGERAEGIRADINKAIDVALPPSIAKNFRAALDMTGAGSNPDYIEAMHVLLAPHFEGKPVVPGTVSKEANKAPGEGPKSLADAMYGHLRK